MEAAKKKHEAIETDTAAYMERVQAIDAVAKELEREGYHDIKRIRGRKDNILQHWEYLQELLRNRRQRLEMNLTLQHLFQEMLHSINWMDEVKVSCRWTQEIRGQRGYGALVPPHRGVSGGYGVFGCWRKRWCLEHAAASPTLCQEVMGAGAASVLGCMHCTDNAGAGVLTTCS